MQDMRTPRAKDYLLRSYQAYLDHWYKSWTSDLPRLQHMIDTTHGTRYSIQELRDLIAEHYPIAEKFAWLEFIKDSVADATGRILKMRWEVVDALDGIEFLTSDLGIVKYFESFEQPCTWRMGFSLGASHWLIPLSPKRGLALIPSTDHRPLALTKRVVRAANKRLVLDAWRFVFTKDRFDFVEKWWAQPGSKTDHFIMPPDL